MGDDDNIIHLFGKDQLDDALYRQIRREFDGHVIAGADYEETCRNYISVATLAWRQKIGYPKLREQLFGLIATLDEKGEFD